MSRFKAHLSFANVIACIALFVALGGTSIAAASLARNSVGTNQLRKGAVRNADLGRSAITSSKIRDGALLSADFKRGQIPRGPTGSRGATGRRGATGSRGATGATGAAGAAGATRVITRTTSMAMAAGAGAGSASTSVGCASGERATGGGVFAANGAGQVTPATGDDVQGSAPIAAGASNPSGLTPTGWAAAFAYTAGAGRTLTFYVICAQP